jgi:hypothetical protein
MHLLDRGPRLEVAHGADEDRRNHCEAS